MPEFLRNNCVTMKEFEKIIILHVGSFGSGGKKKKQVGSLALSRLFMDGAGLSIRGSFWPLIMDGARMVTLNNSRSHIAWIVR